MIHFERQGLEIRDKGPGYRALFTRVDIPAREIVTIWGGAIRHYDEVVAMSDRQHTLQIDTDLFIVTTSEGDFGAPDFVNHSCDPNCGLDGQIVLRAMRDISAGEEITCDYAISESTDIHAFVCECGAENCRRVLTPTDWMLPAVRERYRGWMSPYLARRVAELR